MTEAHAASDGGGDATGSAGVRSRGAGWLRAAARAQRPYRDYWGPDLLWAALFIAVALLLSLGNLDLATSALFYHGGDRDTGWPIGQQGPLHVVQALPSFVVVPILLTSLLYVALSYTPLLSGRYRYHFLFLLVALWIGPGIIVESILKMNYGRPRPCLISQFGGLRTFQSAFVPGIPGEGRSFVSGHAAAMFYLSVFYFLFRRKGRAAFALLAWGLLLGTLVGMGRIASGGHFVSDVAWSLAVVFLTNLVVYYFVLNVPALEDGVQTPLTAMRKHWAFIPLLCTLLAVIHGAVYLVSP